MIIKCVKCKKKFEQKTFERICTENKCKRSPGVLGSNHKSFDYYNSPFHNYMSHLTEKFQNPIKQWYLEFINSEGIPHPTTLNKIAIEQSCQCYIDSCLNKPPHDPNICECACHILVIMK